MLNLIDIKILNTAIERELNKEMIQLGLTFTQTSVIKFLSTAEQLGKSDICQKDIEISLGLTHPTVSDILKRLEKKDMIKSEPLSTDRRYKKISLTKKSQVISSDIQEKADKIYLRILKDINKNELETFQNVLFKMTKNLST